MRQPRCTHHGFTLIELSIVLVIIGLIVGGVLVGQDLIKAAQTRAQISQIEKYNAAVNTFVTKYGGLPGDLNATAAANFGFVARDGEAGRGNGDGIINAYVYGSGSPIGWGLAGENLLFWEDLSQPGFIDGNFSIATDAGINTTSFDPYIPQAKIGNGNYITVFTVNSVNYFQIISPSVANSSSYFVANPAMTVNQAYNIDKKTDDGLPTTGKVQAAMSFSCNSAGLCNAGSWGVQGSFMPPSALSAVTASIATCYDTTTNQYSMTQNNGAGVNCALSFQMQGAAR